MVSHEHKPLNRIDSSNFLDFIHFRETRKIEEQKIEEKKQEPPKEEENLPPPDLPQPDIQKPVTTQALVTTVMGLVAAIPLLLLHSFLSTKSNRLIHILDEKSAAFVAQLSEAHRQ